MSISVNGSSAATTTEAITQPLSWTPVSPLHSAITSSFVRDRLRRRPLEQRAVPAAAHVAARLLSRTACAARVIGSFGFFAWSRPGDREPVVVEGAGRAVGRVVLAEQRARVQRERQLLAVEPHVRVPLAVDAAVALVARLGGGARLHGLLGAEVAELRRKRHHEAVREARRAVRVVRPRQVVEQPPDREVDGGGIAAADRVHQHVAVPCRNPPAWLT